MRARQIITDALRRLDKINGVIIMLLNTSGGRDHHITNSCLVAGGRTRGGQIIGATSNVAMQSVPTNMMTGRPDPGGIVLKPEHVLRTLFDEVGIGSEPDLRVDGLPCLLRS